MTSSRTGSGPLSDALFRTLVDATSAAVFIIAHGRFEYVNPALAALAGYSVDELLAIDPLDLTHPDSLPEALLRLPAVGAVSPLSSSWELRIRARHGDPVWLALSTRAIEVGDDLLVFGVGVDITEARGAHTRSSQLQDVNSVVLLTRGIAHDLNDLLQVIHGHADRMSEAPAGDSRLIGSRAIQDATDRAAELTRHLMTFSRRLQMPHGENVTQASRPSQRERPLVLLVEDEEPVRELIANALEQHGFDVIVAASSEEGVRLERDHHVDLLLSDVKLPGQDGFYLARQILERSPHIRVMFMSGYTGESNIAAAGLDPATPLVQKPFKLVDLVDRIRDTLGVSAPRTSDPSVSSRPT